MHVLKLLAFVTFTLLVIGIQTFDLITLLLFGFLAILLYIISRRSYRIFLVTIVLFGLGFMGYLYLSQTIVLEDDQARVLINRLLLLIPLGAIVLFSFALRQPLLHYGWKLNWNEKMLAPLFWVGLHTVSISHFLLVAMAINILVFMPFIIMQDVQYLQSVAIFAVLFAAINAFLEEFVWRGVLLSRFIEQVGVKWAVALTSIGFGLQHYSLGFSWEVALLFSIGGFFYAGITITSKSIVPAIIWHFVLNLLMVFSGLIV
ncbi:CPBP family intramembrane glutamic endopeptidase [Bacillus horti]|uniref:Membrane protease YdiL (CAAX protease family) n=1 Tax=Caldalkalibacillus horti TaxID=77523 RepID=A0ABT9W544_9BACI|nr:CPBP family intramembrane glutamic endopeptidase [Bacillus horti]MDQ0168356.1 membrane protease YdiL (CAAX protease family) [Bacillus horti]